MTAAFGEKNILIMAGGTGGHVFPALATAKALKKAGYHIHWLGAGRGIETKLVPDAGFELWQIPITGLRGKGLFSWFMAPFKILKAVMASIHIIRKVNPVMVIGMGGYVTGPGGLAAWLLKKPLVIHEQNAVAGLTNRLLLPVAKRVLQAFPDTFRSNDKVIYTGNPVRDEMSHLKLPTDRFKKIDRSIHLLILGGSLGAKAINECIPRSLHLLPSHNDLQVWHQTGELHFEATKNIYQEDSLEVYRLEPFIHDMASALDWADFVICRAGALTVSEISAAGIGSLLVPYPHAVDDHQTKNGAHLVKKGAAMMIQQKDLSPERLASQLHSVLGDPQKLLAMGIASRALAKLDATDRVVEECLSIINPEMVST